MIRLGSGSGLRLLGLATLDGTWFLRESCVDPPWQVAVLVHWMQVCGSFLEGKVGLDDLAHIVRGQYVSMDKRPAVGTVQAPNINLTNELLTGWALLRGKEFIHSNNNIPK